VHVRRAERVALDRAEERARVVRARDHRPELDVAVQLVVEARLEPREEAGLRVVAEAEQRLVRARRGSIREGDRHGELEVREAIVGARARRGEERYEDGEGGDEEVESGHGSPSFCAVASMTAPRAPPCAVGSSRANYSS